MEQRVPPDSVLESLLPLDAQAALDARGPQGCGVWYGNVWSRLGRGDLAWQWWDRVTDDALLPWVAAERGRVLRELGLHADAEDHDLTGRSAATDPVDRAMLAISLVADAVGVNEHLVADERLEEARAAVVDCPDGPRAARQRLRLSWVEVEVALLNGHAPDLTTLPCDGGGPARFPDDYAHGSRFHRAKGLLFGGIAGRSMRLLDEAAAEAPPVLAWAIHLARADHGAEDGLELARMAWQLIVPPPDHAGEIGGTPTAARLATTS